MKIILEPAAADATPNITLRLKNVPLIEVMKYIGALAGYRVKVEDHAITLAPMPK